jgi:hypothetical protein
MVPRGGIEPWPIQLKVHYFFEWRRSSVPTSGPGAFFAAGRVRLCAAIPESCPCHALYKGYHQRRVLRANTDWYAPVAQLNSAPPSEGGGHTFESCRARPCADGVIPFYRTLWSGVIPPPPSRSFTPSYGNEKPPSVRRSHHTGEAKVRSLVRLPLSHENQ